MRTLQSPALAVFAQLKAVQGSTNKKPPEGGLSRFLQLKGILARLPEVNP
jgi:hypothetical protein